MQGHSGQTKDLVRDDEDGFDEVIYPSDFRQVRYIINYEMHCKWYNPYKQVYVSPSSSIPVTPKRRLTSYISTPPKVSSRSPILPKRPSKLSSGSTQPTARATWVVWQIISRAFSRRRRATRMLTLASWPRRRHLPTLSCYLEARIIRPRECIFSLVTYTISFPHYRVRPARSLLLSRNSNPR